MSRLSPVVAVAMCCILACFPILASTVEAAQPPPPATPSTGQVHANTAVGDAWIITWTAKASGHSDTTDGDGTRTVQDQSISMIGSGTARYVTNSDGTQGWKTKNFQWTVTDDRTQDQSSPCPGGGRYYTHSWISDPTYTVFFWADDFLQPSDVYQREDGGHYMTIWFVHSTGGMPALPSKSYFRDDDCYGNTDSGTSDGSDQVMAIWFEPYKGIKNIPTLECDDTGTKCSTDYSFDTVGFGPPLHVTWSIRARRLGKCAGKIGPIDATDPIISNVDLTLDAAKASIPPEQDTSLTLRVTCDGVPVKNASVKVALDVDANSGGHIHDDASHPRPRGYLKGPTDKTYTKITDSAPDITVATNDKGEAVIGFQPGKDTKNERRGIAGTYNVTATSVLFPDRQAKQTIEVERTDFTNLIPGRNYSILRGGAAQHPNGSAGLASTISTIQSLADDFQTAQIQHNLQLTTTGHTAWPTVTLSINDISLEHGGLFDVTGNDVKTGTVTGTPWSPPHYSHRDGKGIDINSAYFRNALRTVRREAGCQECRNPADFLRSTLKSLGTAYGAWEKREPSLHLQVSGGTTKSVQAAAAGPDLGVSVFAADVDQSAHAAPGQTVTYTLAVDNLKGDATAAGTVLTASLPAGLTFVSSDPTPDRTGGSGERVWDIGTLAAGAFPQIVDVVATVGSSVAAGSTLTVTAQATTSGETTPADNTDADGLVIESANPDLVVTTDLDAAAMAVGQTVTFTADVLNDGPVTASGVNLDLTLPVSVTFQSASPTPTTSGQSVHWTLGDLPKDASQAVTVTVAVDPSLAATISSDRAVAANGLLTYTLSASSTATDNDSSDNTVEVVKRAVQPGPDLSTWLAVDGADPGMLTAGQNVTYTLGYANYGNAVAPSTVVTLAVGGGLSLIGADPAPNRTLTSTTYPGGVLSWDVGDLAVGAIGALAVHLRAGTVPADGSLSLVTIGTSAIDGNMTNNAAFQLRSTAPAAPGQYRIFLPEIRRSATPVGW